MAGEAGQDMVRQGAAWQDRQGKDGLVRQGLVWEGTAGMGCDHRNHVMCDDCWNQEQLLEVKRFDTRLREIWYRVPFRVLHSPESPCCFCGKMTDSGILVRRDAHGLNCDVAASRPTSGETS